MLARMTRNTLIGLAAAFSLTTGAMAQDAPALWRVADEDTTIYLFGTIHALPETVEWYRGPIGEALAETPELKEALLQGALQASDVDRLFEHQHRRNHHGVFRGVHAQPGPVYRRHGCPLW